MASAKGIALVARFFALNDDLYRKMRENKLARFGRIVRAHGLKGEVVLSIYGFLSIDCVIDPCSFCDVMGSAYNDFVSIRSKTIVRFANCYDRDSAQSIVGRDLFVSHDNIKADSPYFGSYALIGYEVLLADGSNYGMLVGCFDFGAGVVAEIFVYGDNSSIFLPWSCLHEFSQARTATLIMPEIV